VASLYEQRRPIAGASLIMSISATRLKQILIFHSDGANESIWADCEVCDGRTLTAGQQDIVPGGSYTLPDLRNRFLLGADPTKTASVSGTTVDAASGAPGPKGTGGVHAKTLITAELPSHNHTGSTDNQGAHTHAGSTTSSAGDHTHTGSMTTVGAHTHAGTTISSAGAHTHAGSATDVTGSHTHTVSDPGHTHLINTFQQAIGTGAIGMNFLNVGTAQAIAHQVAPPYGIVSATTNISLGVTGDHSHTLSITSDGNHSHTVSIASDGNHTHALTINSTGAHTHSITLASDGAHSHTLTIGNTGSGQSFDTRPRYYGVVYVMKVRH